MPNNVSFEKVEQVGNNKFAGKFRFESDDHSKHGTFRAFTVKVIPVCKKGFWPWSDCSVDEDDVREELGTAPYEVEETGPNTYYSTKIKRVSIEEEGDCVVIKYRWEMWGSVFTAIPEGAVSVNVNAAGVVHGTLTGNAGFVAHYSGEFHIKICCDDKCQPVISLLGEESATEQPGSGEGH